MSARSKAPRRSASGAGQQSVIRHPPSDRLSPLFWALLACFILSGATGLVYQVLWGRMLSLVFGSTTAATGTVLAVFMGGLALGGWISGRRADALRRPLLVYGLLEAGIGLFALLAPWLFKAAVPVYRWGWQATDGSWAAMFALRFGLALAALLPPTAMMGATLPVLSRLCATRPQTLGARIGALYGANTFGAAVGAFLAGFAVIPLLGMRATLWATALVNFGLLGAAVLLERRFSSPVAQEGMKDAIIPSSPHSFLPSLRVVLVGFGVSGAIALVYEVAWTRALLLIIGSNVQAFAAMLTTFLIGLFLGTLTAARVADRLRNPLVALGWMEAGVGVMTWLGFQWFDSLPWLSLALLDALPKTAISGVLTRFELAALVMLPSALCLGALFPLAVRACEPALARVGRTVGDLYAWNTVGAILGALLASYLLIPFFGTQGTLRAAMVANVLLGMAFWYAGVRVFRRSGVTLPASPSRGGWPDNAPPLAGGDRGGVSARPPERLMALFAIFAAILLLVAWPTRWDELAVVMAQPARRAAATYLRQFRQMPFVSQADYLQQMREDQQILFHAEGASSDVAVVKNPVAISLFTNGHPDASDNPDMPTQILLAALPMLLHPAPTAPAEVAMVGWGSGVTAGVAQQFPLKRLTALELEPQVLRASDHFRHVNHDALRDPRLKVTLEDGRNYFLVNDTTFDVIISEPSNVWQGGVCNLFTREYFQLCRARLRPEGLFAQWIGFGSVPTREVRGILAALREVFPHVLVFVVSDVDAIVLASARPLRVDVARAQSRIRAAHPTLRADLDRAGIPSVPRLVARLVLGAEELPAFCGREAPNTDDNARLEFAAARAYELYSFSAEGRAAFTEARPADPLKYADLSGLSPAEQTAFRQAVHRARLDGDAHAAPPGE